MTKRREQFNISALKFSDEVHGFLDELSRTRRLSEWIAIHVEKELARRGSLTGEISTSTEIMKELQDIKRLLLQGTYSSVPLVKENEADPIIKQVSTNQLTHTIPEDQLNYNF